jgi:nucleotide-binding universal stress UspA family protein
MSMYQRILVPVDGSPTSNTGLDEAIRLARLTGAQLRVLHVVDPMAITLGASAYGFAGADLLTALEDAGRAILQAARDRVAAAGVAVDTALAGPVGGRVCDHVVEQIRAWRADLVVLGTHGRRGVGRVLLGSDAEQVLRSATVPVLLVRSTAAAAA